MKKVKCSSAMQGLRQVLVTGCLLIMPFIGQSQDCQVVDSTAGKYRIQIDGKDYIAYPPDVIRDKLFERDSLAMQLKAEMEKNDACDSLISKYEETIEAYRRNVALKDSARVIYNNLYQGYRDLYFDYKREYGEPFMHVSGGIGAIRKDDGQGMEYLPAVLVGLSIQKITVWGYFNPDQSGFMVGLVQPIRFNFSLF
jgi:hypothetical protein